MQPLSKKQRQKVLSRKPLPRHSNESPDRQLRDDIVPQLARRIRNGCETWVVHCRRDGKASKITLGLCEKIPVIRTRDMARDLLAEVSIAPALSGDTTMDIFALVFLEDCAARWKPSTLHSHQYAVSHCIIPEFGALPIGAVSRAHVVKWFSQMDRSKGARNRALSVLSSLFTHAEMRGLRKPGSNPCPGMGALMTSHWPRRGLPCKPVT